VTGRACAAVLGLLAACHRAPPGREELLARTAAWLWQQQQADGSWRSERYAVLRSGQAMTPLVLFTLLGVPPELCARPPGGVERALEFVRARVDADGAIGYGDPDLLEYPVYSTAYAVRALVRAGVASDRELVARMAGWLAKMQYDAGEGFTEDDAVFGGFGFGARGLGPRAPGHMDLSHTRRALDALRDAEWGDAQVFARARRFLGVVQNLPDGDGGFFFSPAIPAANKGRGSGGRYRSYATATCDGLLALLAAGAARNDAAVVAAARWLADHPDLDRPAGIPREHPEPWGEALFFYHLAVRAEACGTDVAVVLARLQRADGSFANDVCALMKEDDPLLASALAAIALTGG
jgi:hypothetical protein